MSEPNFRMLIRNLRLMDEAKKAGKRHACGRKMPKPKPLPPQPLPTVAEFMRKVSFDAYGEEKMSGWLDHDWHEHAGIATCRNCLKTFIEADEQDDPIVCWAEPSEDNEGEHFIDTLENRK